MSVVRTHRTRLAALGSVLIAGSLAVTGCSSSSSTSSSTSSSSGSSSGSITSPTAVPSLAAQLPAAVKSSGKLVVGVDASYAPNEFKDDSGHIQGMDVDLAGAIAAKLGLKADVRDSQFTAIIPGIQSNKFQLGMSSFTDSKDREATVDMVTYFTAGTSMAVKKGNPNKISATDLCGKKVAVQTGTTQADEIKNTLNPACQKAGKPTIPNDGDKFDLQTDVTNALVAGRDDAMLADSPVVDYAIKISGQLAKIGDTTDTAPYGAVVAKGSPLTPAIHGAIQSLIDDGTYAKILQKWGVQAGAITKSVVNGAVS
ncbi:ABC transporter substrate-binding protein [Kitasatospora acidiphila]|uniref:ABC transporter substrate-binding protein n=1 Tax=Kitasatospora acidiphila TaxID=2567942 RepID=A0A540W367_9ACTN|nr:ABC transporter substrate-binding protein [Kitasatospora acidiphila]TQF03471.1 ABC transporter substrate-binding protein [Kitasatospora acidiphila]